MREGEQRGRKYVVSAFELANEHAGVVGVDSKELVEEGCQVVCRVGGIHWGELSSQGVGIRRRYPGEVWRPGG